MDLVCKMRRIGRRTNSIDELLEFLDEVTKCPEKIDEYYYEKVCRLPRLRDGEINAHL